MATPGYFRIGTGWFTFDMELGWIKDCGCKIDYKYSMPLPENPSLNIDTATKLKIDMEVFQE